MKPINKKRRRTILLLLLYVAAVTASIFYTVTYFMNNSTERGLLAFERFSEQITYRVSDHLSKYTEQLILLKSELMDVLDVHKRGICRYLRQRGAQSFERAADAHHFTW